MRTCPRESTAFVLGMLTAGRREGGKAGCSQIQTGPELFSEAKWRPPVALLVRGLESCETPGLRIRCYICYTREKAFISQGLPGSRISEFSLDLRSFQPCTHQTQAPTGALAGGASCLSEPTLQRAHHDPVRPAAPSLTCRCRLRRRRLRAERICKLHSLPAGEVGRRNGRRTQWGSLRFRQSQRN